MASTDLDIKIDRTTSSIGLKRRQSDVEEEEDDQQQQQQQRQQHHHHHDSGNKRQRIEDSPLADSALPSATESPAESREPHKRGRTDDEKQRGKRLFGALLGNLNRPSDRVSKKRQEIEARRKAELQRQDEERLEDKQRRLDKLAEHRRKVQKKVDEENASPQSGQDVRTVADNGFKMRLRHRFTLSTANFLQTTAEPRLFYRPWDLRADEENHIAEQLKDAQAQIDRELDQMTNKQDQSQLPADDQNNDTESTNASDSANHMSAPQSTGNHHSAQATAVAVAQEAKVHAQSRPLDKSAAHDVTQPELLQASNKDTDMVDTNLADEAKTAADSDGDQEVQDDEQEANVKPAGATAEAPLVDDGGDHIVESEEDTVIY